MVAGPSPGRQEGLRFGSLYWNTAAGDRIRNEEGLHMNAIRIRRQLDSDTLHLPELKPLLGKMVEIIVREEAPVPAEQASCYDAFFALAGTDVVDPEAYEQLRAASMP
jgi:hypothetical protein